MANCKYTLYGRTFNDELELDDYLMLHKIYLDSVGSSDLVMSKEKNNYTDKQKEVSSRLWLNIHIARGIINNHGNLKASEIYGPDYEPDYSIPGYIGVSTAMLAYTNNGNFAFPIFMEENFWIQEFENLRKGNPSEAIREYYFEKRSLPVTPINDINELNKIKKLFLGRLSTKEEVDKLHGIWPQKGVLGTEIHEVLGMYLKYMRDNGIKVPKSESSKILIRKDVLDIVHNNPTKVKQLSDDNIIDVINNGFLISKAIFDLFGYDADYLTEISLITLARFAKRIDLTTTEEMANHNVLGRLDLIIFDKDGNLHIVDFKCSDKLYANYDDAKKRTFNYQLASYRKLLTTLGINNSNDIPSLHIIPIQMKNFEADNTGHCKYSNILLENNILQEIDTSNPLINSNEFNTVEKVLNGVFRYLKVRNDEIPLKLKDTDEFMKKCFGEYGRKLKTDEEIQLLITEKYEWDIDQTRAKNKKYRLVSKLNKNKYYQGSSEADCFEKLKDDINDRKNRISNLVKTIVSKIDEAQKNKTPLVITKNSKVSHDEGTNEYLTKMLSKYTNPNWRLLNSYTGLLDAGIILFQNIETGLVDVRMISGEFNLGKKILLGNNNTNLLGTFYSDQVMRNTPSSQILESTYGNIELMKIMLILNTLSQNFINTNLSIGEIQIISEGTQDSITANNDQLLWNFSRLCDSVKLKNNFMISKGLQGIKMNSYLNLLHNKITEILNGEWTNSRFQTYTNGIVSKFASTFDLESEKFNKEDVTSLLIKLKDELESKFTDLRSGKINDIDSNDSPQNYVYMYLMGALLECNNINPILQLRDHEKYVLYAITDVFTKGINGSYSDNPGNQLSKILNQIYELCVRAYLNTRDDVYKFNTELRTKTHELKRAKGFNYFKRATYGLEASMYKNMYRKVEYALNKFDLMFKNPFDSSESLNSAEREYLKYALLNISRLRDTRIKTMLDLENKLNDPSNNYLLFVPLTRGSFSSKIVSSGGLLKCIKQKINELNPKYLIEHLKLDLYNVYTEKDEERIRNRELWEMRTGFERGEVISDNNSTNRENWIELMGGINYFETNLELLLLKFKAAHSMRDNMNRVFPLIKALYTHLNFQGILRNSKFTLDLQYINDFITSKIFNRPLDDVEKFKLPMLLALKAMSVTSKFALAYNPKLMYLFIDGVWKICQIAFSKPVGATSSLGKEPFNRKHLSEAWRAVMGDLLHYGDSLSKNEGFNMVYGINDMDTNKLAEAMVSDKLGIGNFWAVGFRFASRPDFYNRLIMFTALMKADNCYDAHYMEGNKLVYDFKKDGRFLHLIKNQKGSEYDKELGLYLKMAKLFELEGTLNDDGTEFKLDLSEIDLGKIKALPRAYTNKLAESIKALGDKIYGYYSHEKKSLMQSYTIGALMFQMHTYWSSKKNQYLSGLIFNQEGYYIEYEEETVNDDGKKELHKWYYVLDAKGKPTPKRDDLLLPGEKAIPMYVWKGRPLEGILLTLTRLVKPTFLPVMDEHGKLRIDPIANYKKAYNEVLKNEDPDLARLYRANLRKLISDLLGWFFIGFLIAPNMLDWAKLETKDSGNEDLLNAFKNGSYMLAAGMLKSSSDDFNFMSSIFDIGLSSGPFSLGSATRLCNNTWAWISGDRDTYDTIIKNVSGLNTMSPIMDYSKYVVLDRHIGDNGNEDDEE